MIPPQVAALGTDGKLSAFHQSFRRTTRGEQVFAEPVELGSLPDDQGAPVHNHELQERILTDGSSNRSQLVIQAQAIAEGRFRVQRPEVRGRVRSYMRPWRVNCNGLVSGVEWTIQPDGCGWATTVTIGKDSNPFLIANKTHERGRSPLREIPGRAPRRAEAP